LDRDSALDEVAQRRGGVRRRLGGDRSALVHGRVPLGAGARLAERAHGQALDAEHHVGHLVAGEAHFYKRRTGDQRRARTGRHDEEVAQSGRGAAERGLRVDVLSRGYGRKSGADLTSIAAQVDWVEAYNARIVGGSANDRAAAFAKEHALPGLCASDSHTVLEVGVSSNAVSGDPTTPAGLLASLADVEMHPYHASYYVRAWTPLAKLIQSARGNGRRPAAARPGELS